jgi:hypothetical protein
MSLFLSVPQELKLNADCDSQWFQVGSLEMLTQPDASRDNQAIDLTEAIFGEVGRAAQEFNAISNRARHRSNRPITNTKVHHVVLRVEDITKCRFNPTHTKLEKTRQTAKKAKPPKTPRTLRPA